MRKTFVWLLISGITGLVGTVPAWSQNDDGMVRGSFLSSRPAKATAAPKKLTIRPTGSDKKNTTAGPTRPGDGKTGITAQPETVLGIGYTIFLQDSNGRPVRVDPAREFRSGDAIRLNVEPNIDGFLYIFHTENDTNPLLLFPDARLQGGNNAVRAHVPYEVPSSTDPAVELRWFVFEGEQAIEKVYIVVTRHPLPGIPSGTALVEYAQSHPDAPNWKPTEEIWAKIQADSRTPLIVSKLKNLGQAQSQLERNAVTRALGLPKTAPPPTVVCLSKEPGRDNIVTVVDLSHK